MKNTKRIISIMLAIVMLAGVLAFATGCKKNDDNPTNNPTGQPTVQPTGDANKPTQKPNDQTGSEAVIPDNWGINPDTIVVDVTYNGEKHEYTAGKLYAFGLSYIQSMGMSEDGSKRALVNYGGVTLKNILGDLGINLEDPQIKKITLVDANGNEQVLSEEEISKINLLTCNIALAAGKNCLDGKSGVYFVVAYNDANAATKLYSSIVNIVLE